MKQISNKEYEKYQQYQTDKLHGKNAKAFLNNPEKSGHVNAPIITEFPVKLNALIFDQLRNGYYRKSGKKTPSDAFLNGLPVK